MPPPLPPSDFHPVPPPDDRPRVRGTHLPAAVAGWLIAGVLAALLVHARLTLTPARVVEAVPRTPGDQPLLAGVRRVYVTVTTDQAPTVDARAVKARVEAALAEGGLTVVEPVPGVPDQAEGRVSVSMGANVLPDGTAVLRSDMALVRSVVAMGPGGPVRGDAPVWLDLSDSSGDGRDLKAQAVRMAEAQARKLAAGVALTTAPAN